MEESCLDFLPLRVVSVGADGKRRFDRHDKQKLIEACLRSGASVASMALKAEVNANQLWRWIKVYQAKNRGNSVVGLTEVSVPAFVPARIAEDCAARFSPQPTGKTPAVPEPGRCEPVRASQRPPLPSRLIAQLPNGVSVELECTTQDTALVTAMIETLGRCDVPARR
jgi:transposase